MLCKTRGIVLHTVKYSETSIIAKIYTESSGMLSFIVRGVRKSGAKTSINLFRHLSLVQLDFDLKPGANIHYLKEIKNDFQCASIPFDILKSSVAIFINEIIYKSIHEEEPNKQLFDFLYNSVKMLDISKDNSGCFHLIFAIQLTRYLGFYPINDYSETKCFFNLREGVFQDIIPDMNYSIDAQKSFYLSQLLKQKYEDSEELKIPYRIKTELLHIIIDFYKIHLNFFKDIKSHLILSEVLK
jgi:DNA repair protein RecO (recombination protein O)